MIEETYPYAQVGDELVYAFRSEGINGVILKIIIFTPVKKNRWNLAFGDWRNSDIDDKVMTNNHDVVKVIGTVAKVTYDFFEKYPNAIVVIKPVDDRRKTLFNIVFKRHYQVITNEVKISGRKKGYRKELYSPNKMYDRFELSLKSKY
jgi:hypothetical protein